MVLQIQSHDRVWWHSALLAGCFCGVLLLSSQSAASLLTYVLTLSMLITYRAWQDVFDCPMIWPIVAVLTYFTVTSLWSENFTYRGLFSIATRALLTFCFVVAVAECQLRGLLQAWLTRLLGLTGAGVALLCIAIFFIEPPADGRLNGLGQLDTQVVAALVFGFTLILLLHSALQPASRYRYLLWAAITVIGLAIVLTGSRNALLSVLYGSLLLLIAHRTQSSRQFVIVALTLAALGASAVAAAWFSADLRVTFFPRGDSFRVSIWTSALQQVYEAPLLGLGILTSDDLEIGGLTFHHPHNLYISAAMQGGFVGLVLFLWLLLRVLRELLRSYDQMDAKLALGILGVALPAYLLDGHELLDKISDTWFLVWLPVAIALGVRWHATYR